MKKLLSLVLAGMFVLVAGSAFAEGGVIQPPPKTNGTVDPIQPIEPMPDYPKDPFAEQ